MFDPHNPAVRHRRIRTSPSQSRLPTMIRATHLDGPKLLPPTPPIYIMHRSATGSGVVCFDVMVLGPFRLYVMNPSERARLTTCPSMSR